MTRPNRVFFINSELNFINYVNTINDYKEHLVKSLVTGHGPFPVVSLKVVNKVATVDIGEAVTIYPGVKINIEGTNVTDIDTWHEVTAFAGTTYQFNVDVPDGNYTSGITMGYPSLGWTLADRDANKILLKSGSSGSSARYTLLSFDLGRPAEPVVPDYTWRHNVTIQNVECDGTISSVRMKIPFNREIGVFLLIESGAPMNIPHHFYFYGDDAFCIFGAKNWFETGGNLWRLNANYFQGMFGELARGPYKNGTYFINGINYVRALFQMNYDPAVGIEWWRSSYAGVLSGEITSFHDSMVASSTVNEYNNYAQNTRCLYELAYRDDRTGNRDTTGWVNVLASNNYGNMVVLNSNDEVLGIVPGAHALRFKPNMTPMFNKLWKGVDPVESFLKPLTATGRLKNRFLYAFYSNGYNSVSVGTSNNGGNYYGPWSSVAMFDLTGPIR